MKLLRDDAHFKRMKSKLRFDQCANESSDLSDFIRQGRISSTLRGFILPYADFIGA